jgi:UDP-N-acetylglucosamine 3-dehydrogenase
MLKVAIIGAGHIGHIHARCYAKNADSQAVAICDIDEARGRQLADTFGLRYYSDVAEMLRNEELDFASIATGGEENGSHHYEPTMQTLEAGLPTLCEKPISNKVSEAREMVAKAREKNLVFGINLNHRFTPVAWRLKELQNEGRIGETLFINMALWINNPAEKTPYHHIRALHPHSIDVMRYFGGDISRVQCFMMKAPNRGIWSTLSLNVQFASGAVGHLSGSWDGSMLHPIERCEVAGSAGRGVIENVFERLTYYPRDSREKIVIDNGIFDGLTGFEDTHKLCLDRFVARVLASKNADFAPVEGSGEDGLAAQEVIEAAIRSHENGKIEDVNI